MHSYSKRITAYVLLISQLLMSCSNWEIARKEQNVKSSTELKKSIITKQSKIPYASRSALVNQELVIFDKDSTILEQENSLAQAATSSQAPIKKKVFTSFTPTAERASLVGHKTSTKAAVAALESIVTESQQGYKVCMTKIESKWMASVKENLTGFSRSLELPVYVEEGYSVQEASKHNTWIVLPEQDKQTDKGYVWIGGTGVLGGGNSGSKGEKIEKT